MSGINKQRPPERDPLKLGVSPRRHPHRRHKRFRVRPEATGVGYESFEAWAPPSSRPAAALSGPPDPPVVQVDSPPQGNPSDTGPKPLSEEEVVHVAARRGVRLCLTLLVFLVALVCARARFGSFKGVALWVVGKMAQPVVVERPAKPPPAN